MELIKSPDPWLQTKVKPFFFSEMDVKTISGEMCQIMMAKNGLGLSANQVGLDAQIFVMRPLEHPEITKPFAVVNIRRPKSLVAKFLDIDEKECILEFTGIDARCFAHEYDHLQGIEFTDRVSRLKLDMAKKKQRKLING